ncbi:MAG: hypothetical protein WBC44_02590 [Planctomycetaceae bacterium]
MPSLRLVVACSLALGLVSFVAAPQQADARPQYLKAFAGKYKNLEDQAKEAKCTICHYGKSKKNNNDYGDALKKHFGEEKNVKDAAVIDKGFAGIEKEKSKVESKTFGDLIKDNKLPGTNPEEPTT